MFGVRGPALFNPRTPGFLNRFIDPLVLPVGIAGWLLALLLAT
jgi:hypothetical protein